MKLTAEEKKLHEAQMKYLAAFGAEKEAARVELLAEMDTHGAWARALTIRKTGLCLSCGRRMVSGGECKNCGARAEVK